MASYQKVDESIDHQILFDYEDGVVVGPNETVSLNIGVPDCAAQIDIFYGDLLLSMDGQRYGVRLLSARHIGGTNYCVAEQPTGTAYPYPTPTETPPLTPTVTPITPTPITPTPITPTPITPTPITPTPITPTPITPTPITPTPITPTSTPVPQPNLLMSQSVFIIGGSPLRNQLPASANGSPDGYVFPGDTVRYTVSLNNIGPGAATNIIINDLIPGHMSYMSSTPAPIAGPNPLVWNYASLAGGSSIVIQFEVTVDLDIVGIPTTFLNTAFASSTQIPSVSSNTTELRYDPGNPQLHVELPAPPQ